MRVHNRMPVILATDAARRWIEPGPLPAELLVPYPADVIAVGRVGDDAKNSRIEPPPGMAEPVAAGGRTRPETVPTLTGPASAGVAGVHGNELHHHAGAAR